MTHLKTYLDYVMFIGSLLQQRLHERSWMLRCTYNGCCFERREHIGHLWNVHALKIQVLMKLASTYIDVDLFVYTLQMPTCIQLSSLNTLPKT
jgi:hypothetical protein